MSSFDLDEIERRMRGALNVLKQEFGGLRTGRASASLLDPIMVSAYGNPMPLNQVATVNVPEPRMITVQVWDKSQINAVDKAIGTVAASTWPLPPLVLVVSGRQSFEIVQKAAVAGIGAIVGVSAPSSLAVDLASSLDMLLIGFARGDGFNVYSGETAIDG